MSFSSSASAPAVSDPERLDKWCSIAQGRREFIDGCRMERDPISGRYLGEVPAVNIVAVECDSWSSPGCYDVDTLAEYVEGREREGVRPAEADWRRKPGFYEAVRLRKQYPAHFAACMPYIFPPADAQAGVTYDDSGALTSAHLANVATLLNQMDYDQDDLDPFLVQHSRSGRGSSYNAIRTKASRKALLAALGDGAEVVLYKYRSMSSREFPGAFQHLFAVRLTRDLLPGTASTVLSFELEPTSFSGYDWAERIDAYASVESLRSDEMGAFYSHKYAVSGGGHHPQQSRPDGRFATNENDRGDHVFVFGSDGNQNEAFVKLSWFIANHVILARKSKTRQISNNNNDGRLPALAMLPGNFADDDEDDEAIQPIVWGMAPNARVSGIFDDDAAFEARVEKVDAAVGDGWRVMAMQRLTVTISHRRMGAFAEAAARAFDEAFRPKRNSQRIKVYFPRKRDVDSAKWSSFGYIPHRPADTLILGDGLMDRLVEDAKTFVAERDVYERAGMPYKRIYCLHGPPGTGKTSAVVVLAGELKKDIAIVSVNGLRDDMFIELMKNLPDNVVLLFEDVDALFRAREGDSMTFSTLLNVFDGVLRPHGVLIVLTTNHLDQLDPAMVRPGRIDLVEELGLTTPQQRERIWRSTFPAEQPPDGLLDGRLEVSSAWLSTELFRLRRDPAAAAALFEARDETGAESVPADNKPADKPKRATARKAKQ